MEKYLIITDNTGKKNPIDLTQVLGFDSSNTRLDVIFKPITGNTDLRLRINHSTAPNAFAFQNWFVEEMESILSGNWREVANEPTPPYAVTSISNV